jgi:hypothetical protein
MDSLIPSNVWKYHKCKVNMASENFKVLHTRCGHFSKEIAASSIGNLPRIEIFDFFK